MGRDDIFGRARPGWRRLSWWPWLLAPAGVGLLLAANAAGVDAGRFQGFVEPFAPLLIAGAVIVYAIKAAYTRNPLLLILTALSLSLFCRECQEYRLFAWAHRGIYVMLAGVAIWALAWRRRIRRPLRDVRHSSWLLATMWTYLVAFLLYKRVFRFIPGEEAVHNFLEEGIETVAHLMLVATSLLASLRRYRRGRRR